MPNLDLVREDDVSSFRKIAIGTWANAYDPSVYGTIQLRMDKAMAYLAEFRAKTGRRLTVSHMIARAAAAVFEATPEANAVLRKNRVYLRKRIGIFFQVAMTDEIGNGADGNQNLSKADLSGATLYDVEKMSLLQICDEFERKVDLVRKRQDPALEKTRSTFHLIPYRFLNLFLKTLSFFSYELNLDLRWAGIPSDPFGSIMITNIGSLGLDIAYVPLVPYSHVPILIATGAVKEQAIVENGKIVVGKVMNANATFDHRLIDGFHASMMTKVMREWMENPYEHFDKLDAVTAPPPRAAAPASA
ncbi:MAG TPA: 2-oxo acid dehydrogenase subunit E2 [bacterium]|nr:2-oxo acid dehydrogenase subunit E2 [bacterium]